MKVPAALFIALFSLTARPDTVTRVIDTDAGLGTVTCFHDSRVMVFDAGYWDHDEGSLKAFTGDNDTALLVASYFDSDHVAATDELFNAFRVHRVIRAGSIGRPTNGASRTATANTGRQSTRS